MESNYLRSLLAMTTANRKYRGTVIVAILLMILLGMSVE